MKFLVVILTFVLTLGLSAETIANESEALCTGQDTTKCTQAAEAHQAKSGHKDQTSEMNSLFPEKQKIGKVTLTPSSVELTSPKFLAKISGDVKLEWKESRGANTYHVQIATDPNFKWIVSEDHFVKTNSFTLPKTEAGKKYFWRVAAFNTDNDSMFTKSLFSSSVFVAK